MDEVKNLTAWLAALIPLAAAPRAVILIMSMLADDEQASSYKRKLKHLFYFVIIGETAAGLLTIIQRYLTLGG